MTVLAVEGLRKSFGGVAAVAGVSFAVAAGEMLALIGPNGAGKSTCFNMVGGQLRPTAAPCSWRAEHRRDPAAGDLPAGRGTHLPDHRDLCLDDGARERAGRADGASRHHLASGGARRTRLDVPAADALLDQVGLTGQAERATGVLAYGDLKRLELAIALAAEPRLLLMDEPTAGMAPRERVALMQLVRRIANRAVAGGAVHRARHGRGVRRRRPHRRAGPRRTDRQPATARRSAPTPRVRAIYLGTGSTSGGH